MPSLLPKGSYSLVKFSASLSLSSFSCNRVYLVYRGVLSSSWFHHEIKNVCCVPLIIVLIHNGSSNLQFKSPCLLFHTVSLCPQFTLSFWFTPCPLIFHVNSLCPHFSLHPIHARVPDRREVHEYTQHKYIPEVGYVEWQRATGDGSLIPRNVPFYVPHKNVDDVTRRRSLCRSEKEFCLPSLWSGVA